MNDQLSKENLTHNLPVYSVGEISTAIKNKVEANFNHVRVRGEISSCKQAASGHIYFSLKDETFVLDSICWRSSAIRLKTLIEDGIEVIALGRLTTYGVRSKYQMIVESIELAGEGALLRLLEERKRKLAQEGLFSESSKRKLPFLPETIGVITSPSGAVIRDILQRLDDRFGRHVLLWPVPVQGQKAAEKIAEAINGFNTLDPAGDIPQPDVLIIARGGGSLEDLWPFNEEIVVRATASSQIPTVSAIGHEVDTTLIDYASDKRAPTPSAAIEMTVPVRSEVFAHLLEQEQRIGYAMNRFLKDLWLNLQIATRGLPNLIKLTEDGAQRLDEWGERLENGLVMGIKSRQQILSPLAQRVSFPYRLIEQSQKDLENEIRNFTRALQQYCLDKKNKYKNLSKLLESFSYERTLDRGFALLQKKNGKTILSAEEVSVGDKVSAILSNGNITLEALHIEANQTLKEK